MPTRRQRQRFIIYPAISPLSGATWAVSGGNASNTPTLGAELLTNGGFDSWSGDNPVGWTVTAEDANNFVTQSGSAARLVSPMVGQTALSAAQYSVATVGGWYRYALDVTTLAAGFVSLRASAGLALVGRNSAGALLATYRATSGARGYEVWRTSAQSNDFTVDNATLRQITTSSLFATIAGSSSTQTAAAKIAALTTSTQAGVVSLLDSATSPANFLIAYHDGSNVRLEKCVAGTYTSLISTAVAFSAGAQIEIRRPSGNTFQLWYNGAQRGVDQTVSDAGIINNSLYGLFSTYSDNTYSELTLDGRIIPFVFGA